MFLLICRQVLVKALFTNESSFVTKSVVNAVTLLCQSWLFSSHFEVLIAVEQVRN